MAPESPRERDRRLMGEALGLARRGRGRTSPNPMVGAVIADARGGVAGRGWHERAGAPHAEALALREAGPRSRGATLYVTLEPCAHHGRTPPCAPALLEAGVRRVVAAVRDPDPRVSGAGLRLLREGGAAVEEGLRAREAARLNEAHFCWAEEGIPFVTLKVAASLDGRIATRSGESRWITGEAAREWAHAYRDAVDAILVGAETVRKDDPLLTARPQGREGKPLIRVVLDSRLRTSPGARILPPDRGVATILATTEGAPRESEDSLRKSGAEVLRFARGGDGRVPLRPLLQSLGERGVRHLLVEGGGRVHGSFVRENLAHKVLYFLAPLIIGDDRAPAAVTGSGLEELAGGPRLVEVEYKNIGPDILIKGYLKPPVWAKYGDE